MLSDISLLPTLSTSSVTLAVTILFIDLSKKKLRAQMYNGAQSQETKICVNKAFKAIFLEKWWRKYRTGLATPARK